MIANALNQKSVCTQFSISSCFRSPIIKRTLQLVLVFGFLQWMVPAANAGQHDQADPNADPRKAQCEVWGPPYYWSDSDNNCKKCDPFGSGEPTVWDEATRNCVGSCSQKKPFIYYDPLTKGCNCTPCANNAKPDPNTCQCVVEKNPNKSCGSPDAIFNLSTNQCECIAPNSTYDLTTKTCINGENPPQKDPPNQGPPKKYKNQNLRNCLEGASNSSDPQLAEFDCVPTPQNDDGSLSNADDKDYTKWSDDLYPGKSKAKPITGFYSKKLVRCDNATAASEECPIAVKAKFVITCKTGKFYWKQELGKCTIASKIRTFYATYQAFVIPGQKPIKANIVGDSTNSNTPATAIRVQDIVGAGEP
jgi:hypothetical protein